MTSHRIGPHAPRLYATFLSRLFVLCTHLPFTLFFCILVPIPPSPARECPVLARFLLVSRPVPPSILSPLALTVLPCPPHVAPLLPAHHKKLPQSQPPETMPLLSALSSE